MTRSTTAAWSVVAVLLVLASIAPAETLTVCGQSDAEYAMAHIACPPNEVIVQIPFAAYGLPTGSCPHYTRSTACDAKTALSVVAGLCLGRNNCSVEQNGGSGPMGDPCFGGLKRLRVVAQCAPVPKAPLPSLAPYQGSYVCGKADREHERANVVCPPGSLVVAIPFASYGLPSGSCPDFAVNARCHADSTMSVVAGLCLGRNNCSVEQNGGSGPMGDPCFGVHKRLRVVAQCAPAPSSPTAGSYVCGASDNEFQYAQVSCPANWVVEAITFASYGLPTGDCPCYKADPQCDARRTLAYASGLCLGRNNCSIEQNGFRGPLGDPCPNVFKRLRVVAHCIPPAPAMTFND